MAPGPDCYPVRKAPTLTAVPYFRSRVHRFPAKSACRSPASATTTRTPRYVHTARSQILARASKASTPRDGETHKSLSLPPKHPPGVVRRRRPSLTPAPSLIPTGGPLLLRDRRRRPHQRGHQGCRRRLAPSKRCWGIKIKVGLRFWGRVSRREGGYRASARRLEPEKTDPEGGRRSSFVM